MSRLLLMVQQFTQGGSERQCAQAAIALHRAGHEVYCAALRPGGMRAAELAAAGVPLTVFPVASFASLDPLRQGLRFLRFLRRERIGVVHSFDVPSNVFAVPWARLARVPLVLSSQRAHRDLTPSQLRPFEKLAGRLADKIVVNCQSVRHELIESHGVAPERTPVVYNGIDTAYFTPQGPRAPLPFPPGAVVVGALCALRPEKDLPTLLRAFAKVASRFPQAYLLLAGGGPERTPLEALSIPSRTYFAGAQADTAPWYRAIDYFVLPSRSEALSNSLLEAWSCGCVCIASHAGGNPEIVRDASRLFPPGDDGALAALLAGMLAGHPRHRRVQPLDPQFRLDRMAANLAEIYGL